MKSHSTLTDIIHVVKIDHDCLYHKNFVSYRLIFYQPMISEKTKDRRDV